MPRMPNAYPLLVLVSITAKPEYNPLIPGMTHAQRFEKKKTATSQIITPPIITRDVNQRVNCGVGRPARGADDDTSTK